MPAIPTLPLELPALWLAILIDLGLRDPPNPLHPVAWMGTAIAAFRRRAPQRGRWLPFCAGALFIIGGTASVAILAFVVQSLIRRLPLPIAILAEALVLKSAFSVGGLVRTGNEVHAALVAGDLAEARRLLGWHLVSRDTSHLTDSQVAAATIESLAENTSDSLVAPLLFYALAGLPGALAYRFVNTCDAMLGYRTAELQWLGKPSARLDDLANLVPSRLSAALILFAGTLLGYPPVRAVAVWLRDRRATSSPNAGHPMSAVAGILGVELEKSGYYRLGLGQRPPAAGDIVRTAHLLHATAALAMLALSIVLLAKRCP